MEKFDELLKELKARDIIQTSICWEENIPEDLWNKYFNGYEETTEDLNIDKHRWYKTSTTVAKVDNRFLGINLITNMYNESSDISREIEFFEMEEIQSVTYIKKKEK